MSTAEQLAFSIHTERRGIHVLLWDQQDDLVRALLGFLAALDDMAVHPVLVSGDPKDRGVLAKLVATRLPSAAEEDAPRDDSGPVEEQLWTLFLQQASTQTVGPWLNGWRRPISSPPGSLLVIRHADFKPFQQHAPDIASFIGPRIFDASTMLSMFSRSTHERLQRRLPVAVQCLLARLPGTPPSEQDIQNWIEANVPDEA